jgi:hypothetical protein
MPHQGHGPPERLTSARTPHSPPAAPLNAPSLFLAFTLPRACSLPHGIQHGRGTAASVTCGFPGLTAPCSATAPARSPLTSALEPAAPLNRAGAGGGGGSHPVFYQAGAYRPGDSRGPRPAASRFHGRCLNADRYDIAGGLQVGRGGDRPVRGADRTLDLARHGAPGPRQPDRGGRGRRPGAQVTPGSRLEARRSRGDAGYSESPPRRRAAVAAAQTDRARVPHGHAEAYRPYTSRGRCSSVSRPHGRVGRAQSDAPPSPGGRARAGTRPQGGLAPRPGPATGVEGRA